MSQSSQPSQSGQRRKKKLSKPGMQIRLVSSFVGLAAVAMLLQFLVLGFFIVRSARELDGPGGELLAGLPSMMLIVLGCTIGVLLPVVFGLGVLLTHRIAGPIYRFETYLNQVARGEASGPCKIRDGDQLGELCAAINAATAPLVAGTDAPAAESAVRATG